MKCPKCGVEYEDEIELCDLLIEIAEKSEEQPIIFDSLLRQLAFFLYDIIRTRKDRTISLKLLDRLVTNTKSLILSHSTLLTFLDEYEIWKGGKYFPDKNLGKELADHSLALGNFALEAL